MNKTGILLLFAAITTILELYAYGICFIGPLMAFMALMHHQDKKRIKE